VGFEVGREGEKKEENVETKGSAKFVTTFIPNLSNQINPVITYEFG